MENQFSTQFFPIHIVGYQAYEIPPDVMEALQKETSKMISKKFKKSVPYNNTLIGHIEHEYQLKKSINLLEHYISATAPLYWNNFTHKNLHLNANKKHVFARTKERLPAVWVNFQKKYEFQPVHHHHGVLSFVIFLKIPYTLEEENRNFSSANNNNPLSGTFNFIYNDEITMYQGSITNQILPIDKESEGTMIIFPASLNHIVYPFFSSDEYRITISGNIEFDES